MIPRTRIAWALVLSSAVAARGSAQQALRYSPTEIAEGVHVFAPSDAGLGNVTVIVSAGQALVVDATGTPDAASTVLDSLRAIGVERVVGVVNTHWHDDHIWGNQVFSEAFPDLKLFAHPATIHGIRARAVPALSGQIERLHARIAERRAQLEAGTNADGSAMSAEERTALEARQALFSEAVASLEKVRPTLPDTEVGTETNVRVGDLDVRLLHVGAGHTAGDLVVHVPERRVLVVGDLITLPVPAAAEAFPVDWIGVLERVDAMDWTRLVPGHGAVQSDRDYLRATTSLLRELVAYVRAGIEAGTSVDDLVAGAAFEAFRDRFVGTDGRAVAMFQAFFVEAGVRSAHAQLTRPSRRGIR